MRPTKLRLVVNAALARCQNAHVAAQTGAAGGGGDDAARIDKGGSPAPQDALLINSHGGGDDDAAHALGDVLALEDVVGGFHVLQTAVGAAADDHLIDLDVLALAGNMGILGQVGVADGGLQCAEVDLDGLFVHGIGVSFVEHRRALAAACKISLGHLVHREDAVLGTGLNRHIADAQAVVHGKPCHARAGELHRLIQCAVHTDHADDMQNQILAGHPGVKLAKHELDGRGHLEPCHAGSHASGHIGIATPVEKAPSAP